jgi:putative endopeptidase
MRDSAATIAIAVLVAAGCARVTPGTPVSRTTADEQGPPAQATPSEPAAPSPTRNFYQWANADWLARTPIPPDKPGVNNFLLIRTQVDKDLQILLTALKGKPGKSADERKLAVLFEAYMDMKKRNALGLSPLRGELRRIDRAKSRDDIAVLFARMQTLGVEAPLVFTVSTDFKKSDRYIVFATQAGLGLEREDYLGEDERSAGIRRHYQELVEKVFELAAVKDAAAQARSVVALEQQLAVIQWSKVDNRDITKVYNVTDFKGLAAKARNLTIERQLPALHLPTRYPFNVMQPSYVEALNEFFVTQDLRSWKAYLKARLLLGYARLLDRRFKAAIAGYEIQRGLYDKEEPLAQQAVRYLNGNVGMLLGKTYVETGFDDSVKPNVRRIIRNIVAQYRIAIGDSPWMTAETKRKAIEKLDKMTFEVGYPDKWRDYSSLKPVAGELVLNHIRIQRYEHKRNIDKLGKPVDRSEWVYPPQTVNAYYEPSKNSFVLLAGILHPPFFSPGGSDAEHYGGIGFVIGHEIGHGFDDQGSRFDGDGNLVNWWSKEDAAAYDKIRRALIAQADRYEIFPGKYLKGELEIGEIMGDLSGAEIALRAYRKVIDTKRIDEEEAYRAYFTQLARTWRDKLRADYQLLLLDKDPHPPSEFRANGIVKNFDEFHQVFRTKPGDLMYLRPAERVHMW